MSTQADVLYLPVLSPARVPSRDHARPRYPKAGQRALQTWRQRVYRAPPRRHADGKAYGPDGYLTLQGMTGTIIDLYA